MTTATATQHLEFTTPYGSSSEEYIVRETFRKVVGEHLAKHPAFVESAREIERLRRLPEGWDGEDGLPSSDAAVQQAQRILLESRIYAFEHSLDWEPPDLTPTPEGGIDMSWDLSGRRLLLIVQPGGGNIVCVLKCAGASPQRHVYSLEWALACVHCVLG